jgi:hypothetical protein
LILIVLIFNFFSWPFYKSFICFQFHLLIQVYGILFLPICSSFFLFFSFIKVIFLFNFTLQSNIKFILYFNLNSHSFNCYFLLWILLYNWKKIPISFKIWLIENCASWFFQITCFEFNESGYEFEKLTWIESFLFKKWAL